MPGLLDRGGSAGSPATRTTSAEQQASHQTLQPHWIDAGDCGRCGEEASPGARYLRGLACCCQESWTRRSARARSRSALALALSGFREPELPAVNHQRGQARCSVRAAGESGTVPSLGAAALNTAQARFGGRRRRAGCSREAQADLVIARVKVLLSRRSYQITGPMLSVARAPAVRSAEEVRQSGGDRVSTARSRSDQPISVTQICWRGAPPGARAGVAGHERGHDACRSAPSRRSASCVALALVASV